MSDVDKIVARVAVLEGELHHPASVSLDSIESLKGRLKELRLRTAKGREGNVGFHGYDDEIQDLQERLEVLLWHNRQHPFNVVCRLFFPARPPKPSIAVVRGGQWHVHIGHTWGDANGVSVPVGRVRSRVRDYWELWVGGQPTGVVGTKRYIVQQAALADAVPVGKSFPPLHMLTRGRRRAKLLYNLRKARKKYASVGAQTPGGIATYPQEDAVNQRRSQYPRFAGSQPEDDLPPAKSTPLSPFKGRPSPWPKRWR